MRLHAWLRSGNTSASRVVFHFLAEALSLLPSHWKIRCVRADSGFFAQELLSFLEQRALPYLVVAKLTQTIKCRAAGISNWTEMDADYAVGEFFAKLQGWEKERRLVVVRERVSEAKDAVGRTLIDVPGYTFRIFATNRMGDPLELWRDDNKRAVIEQRIEEIKAELHADGFCMKNFFATESAFLAVLFTFNLLSLYQKVVLPEAGYRQPAALRAAVFLRGALLGRAARKPVILLSEAWVGLKKHIPFIERILLWKIPSWPKLESDPPDPLTCCSI